MDVPLLTTVQRQPFWGHSRKHSSQAYSPCHAGEVTEGGGWCLSCRHTLWHRISRKSHSKRRKDSITLQQAWIFFKGSAQKNGRNDVYGSCCPFSVSPKGPCLRSLVPRMVILGGGKTFKRGGLVGGGYVMGCHPQKGLLLVSRSELVPQEWVVVKKKKRPAGPAHCLASCLALSSTPTSTM